MKATCKPCYAVLFLVASHLIVVSHERGGGGTSGGGKSGRSSAGGSRRFSGGGGAREDDIISKQHPGGHEEPGEAKTKSFVDTADFVALLIFLGMVLIFISYKLFVFVRESGHPATHVRCYLCCKDIPVLVWISSHREKCIRKLKALEDKYPLLPPKVLSR